VVETDNSLFHGQAPLKKVYNLNSKSDSESPDCPAGPGLGTGACAVRADVNLKSSTSHRPGRVRRGDSTMSDEIPRKFQRIGDGAGSVHKAASHAVSEVVESFSEKDNDVDDTPVTSGAAGLQSFSQREPLIRLDRLQFFIEFQQIKF
jgi:hypothetical protein